MKKEILCTLGPASWDDRTLAQLEELGATLFRINLSHTRLDDLEGIIQSIQRRTKIPLCLDTEGAQIRTGELAGGEIHAEEGNTFYGFRDEVLGNAQQFNFYPLIVFDLLLPGDRISIDFNSVLVEVTRKDRDRIAMRVLEGGKIGQNKAVTVTNREVPLPVMTEKDHQALGLGKRMGIRHVALSFANRGSDVDLVRSLAAEGALVISKIECRNGLKNLKDIAEKSDALLIDRGDLSREEPIERIPKLQKMIIRTAKESRKKIYVATNLLESMVISKTPTRAEVNDIYNTLLDGADGLVLAAETAIGRHPLECVRMIARVLHEFEEEQENGRFDELEDSQAAQQAPERGRANLTTKDIVQNFCVPEDYDLEAAFLKLNKTGFGVLFVVDERGRMIGLVTDRELRKAMLTRLDLSTPIRRVMNKNFLSGRADDPREESLNILQKARRRQLPLLDGEGRVVDVILIDEFYYGSRVLTREYQ